MIKSWQAKLLLAFAIILMISSVMKGYSQSLLKNTTDPLPSWNEGEAKRAIMDFVKTSTNKNNPNYIEPSERIAAFDQDGTLWVEQPMYTQVIFAFEQIIALASKHPEWKTTQPFKAIISHDKAAMAKFTLQDLEKILFTTHSGMSVTEFENTVKNWLHTAKNPRWQRPYTELVYLPMLEVLTYLRANGFKTYIVTGGGQDFVRVYAQEVYGIPPEQVIGSAVKTNFITATATPELVKSKTLLLNNNYAGKPENIYLFIGKKSRAAFGNSTGDQQMLEYTQTSPGAHLMLLIHHDDAEREYSYGANSKVGTFSPALMSEANKNAWTVVSMKNDWRQIFAFENRRNLPSYHDAKEAA